MTTEEYHKKIIAVAEVIKQEQRKEKRQNMSFCLSIIALIFSIISVIISYLK